MIKADYISGEAQYFDKTAHVLTSENFNLYNTELTKMCFQIKII